MYKLNVFNVLEDIFISVNEKKKRKFNVSFILKLYTDLRLRKVFLFCQN